MVCDILVTGLEAATGPAGAVVAKAYEGGKLITDATVGRGVDATTGAIMLAKNKAKIIELAARGSGAGKFADAIDKTQQLVSMGEAMWSFMSGAKDMQDGGSAGIRSASRTARGQLEKIRMKIRDIEAEVRSCDASSPMLS